MGAQAPVLQPTVSRKIKALMYFNLERLRRAANPDANDDVFFFFMLSPLSSYRHTVLVLNLPMPTESSLIYSLKWTKETFSNGVWNEGIVCNTYFEFDVQSLRISYSNNRV